MSHHLSMHERREQLFQLEQSLREARRHRRRERVRQVFGMLRALPLPSTLHRKQYPEAPAPSEALR
jgi:hypothetical protein